MKNNSYHYRTRKGLKTISWDEFYGICKGLAMAVSKYNPDVILGVARGGLYPATLISHLLQKEFYPVRLTRRVDDIVIRDHPIWLIKPPEIVKGKKVLIVDEISDSGESLLMVKTETLNMGAKEVKSAVMYSHNKSRDIPDYIGIITDELILNPWDREILKDNKYIFHPEYVGALEKQNLLPEKFLLLGIEPTSIAKSCND